MALLVFDYLFNHHLTPRLQAAEVYTGGKIIQIQSKFLFARLMICKLPTFEADAGNIVNTDVYSCGCGEFDT